MDNISEARTEVVSISTTHHEHDASAMSAPATSVSQDPIFDAAAHQLHDDNENELNVSLPALPEAFGSVLNELLSLSQGFNERKVGFSVEENDSDNNDSENDEMANKQPIKLHRRYVAN